MPKITHEEAEAAREKLHKSYEKLPLEFSIGLQNFQSIRQYTEIKFAPITLIYGQNSAGKSAIHDALIFLHNFLKGDIGVETDLNRWANKNRHTRPLTCGYLGKPDDVVFTVNAWTNDVPYDYINKFTYGLKDLGVNNFLEVWYGEKDCEIARFKLQFHYSKPAQDCGRWNLREFFLFVGDEREAFIHFLRNDDGNDSEDTFSINKTHPFTTYLGYYSDSAIEDLILLYAKYLGINIIPNEKWIQVKGLAISSDWIKNKSPLELCAEAYDEYTDEINPPSQAIFDILKYILISPSLFASNFAHTVSIPPLRPVPSEKTSFFTLKHYDYYKLNDQYSIDEPWKLLAKDIAIEQYSKFLNQLNPESKVSVKDLYNELNYPFFPSDSELLLNYVNHVISHPLFMDTGYEVVGNCEFILSNDELKKIIDLGSKNAQGKLTIDINTKVHLKIRQINDDFTTEIEDVGVGISQVIPVICALFHNYYSTYIQQPELHLHPKQQSHIGDMLIERINKASKNQHDERNFIIETHSEHILLRILRRIRETNRGDIKHQLFGITSNQLSVLYVDKNSDGDSQIMNLRVADNGEFIDRWPHGFFTERDADLFDE